jgi:uncharacterized protein YecE (DUF72 family)
VQPLHVGCSGWAYDSWRGVVYPKGLPKSAWLSRYAEVFDTVEVNSSFYRLPSEAALESWCSQVPGDFLFAFKASRYLTHVKRLKGIGQGIRRLWGRLRPVRESGRLGPILWQLPPDFRADRERIGRLTRLLELAPAEGRHAIEFRHPSWFTREIRELLDDRGAALVVADDGRRPLPDAEPTADWSFVRLHYGHRGRRGNYSEAELDTWRRRIAAWRSRREVFAYFNNDWEGFAPRNAVALERRSIPAPDRGMVGAR